MLSQSAMSAAGNMNSYYIWFSQSAMSAAGNMKGYYEEQQSEPMFKLLDKLHMFSKDSCEKKYPLLQKTVDEQVSAALNKLHEKLAYVKGRMKLRNDARINFDHYNGKMSGLRKEREKIIANGQLAGWKNKDKFERNEKKYQAARDQYERTNAAVIEEMKELYETRFQYINAMCSGFIKMQMYYFAAYGKACSSYIGPLKQVVAGTTQSTISSGTTRSRDSKGDNGSPNSSPTAAATALSSSPPPSSSTNGTMQKSIGDSREKKATTAEMPPAPTRSRRKKANKKASQPAMPSAPPPPTPPKSRSRSPQPISRQQQPNGPASTWKNQPITPGGPSAPPSAPTQTNNVFDDFEF
uniref:BAR domain-containing protein n=1 Tax=Bigelowiella natans TaxID=227086 RepID=A0A7S2KM24_BIGNA|mmetsp:Transcript_278/g.385  ORF Transcript_278/g.385 Transcript_278/m.385 type:complete len:353 (+) Transcript_278:264-1322(+)